jgi:hypothetical protein
MLKVKFSKKTYGGMDVQIHVSWTSTLVGDEWMA